MPLLMVVVFPVIREMSAKGYSFRRGLKFRDVDVRAMNIVNYSFVRLASNRD